MTQTSQWTPSTYRGVDLSPQDTTDQLTEFLEDRIQAVEDYARVNPWSFGVCMLGIGFVLGWKLKPW